MAAIKRLASKACGPEIDYDHGHDYNLITAEGWQPELSSARRAAVRAEKAMQSAQAGDTMATLSGNIVVSQAIFAELLKRGQEANTQLLEEMQAKDREISDLRAKLEAHEAMRCDFADIQAGIGKQDAKDLEIAKLRAKLEAQEAIERNLADLRANIEEQVVKDREIANLRASLGAYEDLGSQLEDLRAIIEDQVAKDREIAESRMRLEALDDIDQQVMDLRASRESQDVKDREIDELRAKVDAHEATGIAAAEAAAVKQRVIVMFRAGDPAMTFVHQKKATLAKVMRRYQKFTGQADADEDLIVVSRNGDSNGMTVNSSTAMGDKG